MISVLLHVACARGSLPSRGYVAYCQIPLRVRGGGGARGCWVGGLFSLFRAHATHSSESSVVELWRLADPHATLVEQLDPLSGGPSGLVPRERS